MTEIFINERTVSWKTGFKKIQINIETNGFIHAEHNAKEKLIYIICERKNDFEVLSYTDKGEKSNQNAYPYTFLKFDILNSKDTIIICQEKIEEKTTVYKATLQNGIMSSKEEIKPYGYEESSVENNLNTTKESDETKSSQSNDDYLQQIIDSYAQNSNTSQVLTHN